VTGPEHYAEAERLLAGTDEPANPDLGIGAMHYEPSRMELAQAQVHATLALAAATALAAEGLPRRDDDAWFAVAATQRPESGAPS
jgi:hypothetical protein